MNITSWRQATNYAVIKCSPCGIYSGAIDPGVNLFVLLLEHIGATPHYSCEGHPGGFYVVFSASLKVARKIAACGFFRVELERGETKTPRWSIRADFEGETQKENVLTWAGTTWLQQFGPLVVTRRGTEITLPPQKIRR